MFRLLLYLRGNDRIWLQNFSLVLDVLLLAALILALRFIPE